jgi:hypothetical protein
VTPWDDGIFGFVGEVIAGSCASIRLPPEVLTPIPVRAYNAAYMRDNLPNINADTGLFDIPPPDHGEASMVAARGLMALPSRYVPLFLRGRGYTPTEMWDLLLPMLVDDNQHEECLPLIDWLRAASTASGRDPDTQRQIPPLFNLNFNNPPRG